MRRVGAEAASRPEVPAADAVEERPPLGADRAVADPHMVDVGIDFEAGGAAMAGALIARLHGEAVTGNCPRSHSVSLDRGRASMPDAGVVKWFKSEKGYGFIKRDTGEDVFVHHSSIRPGGAHLAEGEKVEFDVEQGPKGLQAVNVRRAGDPEQPGETSP